ASSSSRQRGASSSTSAASPTSSVLSPLDDGRGFGRRGQPRARPAPVAASPIAPFHRLSERHVAESYRPAVSCHPLANSANGCLVEPDRPMQDEILTLPE